MDKSNSHDSFDDDISPQPRHHIPHSERHPVPNIHSYYAERNRIDEQQKAVDAAEPTDSQTSYADESKIQTALKSAKHVFKHEETRPIGDPYPTVNRLEAMTTSESARAPANQVSNNAASYEDNVPADDNKSSRSSVSASEEAVKHVDPDEKRKAMKHGTRGERGREVTDPVTHLPVIIRDSTDHDLTSVGFNDSRGKDRSLSDAGLDEQKEDAQAGLDELEQMFPPPSLNDTKAELVRTFQIALVLGVGLVAIVLITLMFLPQLLSLSSNESGPWYEGWLGWRTSQHQEGRHKVMTLVTTVVMVAISATLVLGLTSWLGRKIEGIWTNHVWEAARVAEDARNQDATSLPESVAWLNSVLGAIWPLINPDLFTSLADMLEDVMQASLPKLVRMVSVEDLGQGSETVRILGIRWLPNGAAGQSVDERGNLSRQGTQVDNDRTGDDSAEMEDQQATAAGAEDRAEREGMEAEQGDFVNLELAFAYRARPSGRSLRAKSQNAHILLRFYLTNGIYVPVWVELKGLIGKMRARLQLTPDPPFFSLCTLTFLGQPRADIACVPLSKRLPNLMDFPLISSFVQTSIDAALAEYVAPKSLTLDLKEMLVGDDFKKNTFAKGLVVIFIDKAQDFKQGNAGMLWKKGSSDAYVTCSWAKFGKTLAATRVIEEQNLPSWHEWAFLLVTPEEIDAGERLKVQLWDSDKHTADDDLGAVEVDLKDLMHGSETRNRMSQRQDSLHKEGSEDLMPGTLRWSVGFFAKLGVTDEQISKHGGVDGAKNRDDFKRAVSETTEQKLREAKNKEYADEEIHQQKLQDFRAKEDEIICALRPSDSHPSGILSVQIHNITGLDTMILNRRKERSDHEDEAEQSDDLPSSFCTIIINHVKVYRTRTKPKTGSPFFNAGTERFIRDWSSTEVMISVRDTREGENDALLGILYLPLHRLFANRSQVSDTWPLVGGVGFGKIKVSMMFRSVELKLSPELRGWDYGTLEVLLPLEGKLEQGLQTHRIKMRSNIARVKLVADDGQWREKHGKDSVFLPFKDRYRAPLIIEWRAPVIGPDSTPAFAILWLQDVPDEEERTTTLRVWKGGKAQLARASTCHDYEGLEEDEQLGEINIRMKFWPGLSGYHKVYAKKEKSGRMRDVMHVLDTAHDEKEYSEDDDDTAEQSTETKRQLRSRTDQDTSDSDSSDDSDSNDGDSGNALGKIKSKLSSTMDMIKPSPTDAHGRDDGSRTLLQQARDYKDNRRQLHRKHRGVMQWKAMRSLDWMGGKVRRGVDGVVGEEGLLRGKMLGAGHGEKVGQDVETEV